jgi:hypothetical protein
MPAACRVGDQANCPADSHGKICCAHNVPALLFPVYPMKLILVYIGLCVLFLTNGNAKENTMDYKYTILLEGPKNPDLSLPDIHPVTEGAADDDDEVMVSAQDEDLLKVAFYHPDLKFIKKRFNVHNPALRDFTGMAAILAVAVRRAHGLIGDSGCFRHGGTPDIPLTA